MKTKTYKMK